MSDSPLSWNPDLDPEAVNRMCQFLALTPNGKAYTGFELRWQIVCLLYEGSKTVTQMLNILAAKRPSLSQPLLSHHVALLRRLKFVRQERPSAMGNGRKNNRYSLTTAFRQRISLIENALFNETDA